MTGNCLSLRKFLRPCLLGFIFAGLSWTLPLQAQHREDGAVILVARPQLQDVLYGGSVLIAKPMPDGGTFGFILNKPTQVTLGQLFPGHEPSLKVADPVFLGGPVGTNKIVALVKHEGSPGAGSIRIADGLFLATHSNTVDSIIETGPGQARFFAGIVVWRPGELEEEVKRGFWYELAPDVELVFDKQTDGLWANLLARSRMAREGI